MANPKWKTPRSKTRSRRAANWYLLPVTVTQCPKCHAPRRPHFVCEACGVYNGRQVLHLKTPQHEGPDHDQPDHDHSGHNHG